MSKEAISTTFQGFQAIIPGASQKVAFAGTSVQSTALAAGVSLVRVTADQDCFIAIAANPTAVANTSVFLASGAIEYFGVAITGSKIAVIQSTAAGNLYITEAA